MLIGYAIMLLVQGYVTADNAMHLFEAIDAANVPRVVLCSIFNVVLLVLVFFTLDRFSRPVTRPTKRLEYGPCNSALGHHDAIGSETHQHVR